MPRTARAVAFGLAMPLVIQGLIDVPLLWWGRRATWDYLTPIVLVSYVAITTFGFLMATVGYRRPLRIGIAVAYFPANPVLVVSRRSVPRRAPVPQHFLNA